MLKFLLIGGIFMSKQIERKVLILIPSLDEYIKEEEKIESLTKLRQEFNLIARQVSDTINRCIYKEFHSLNRFTAKFGTPRISLKIVDCKNNSYKHGIRLCLTKFDQFDFSKNFTLQTSDYEENDISHLIELVISTKQQNPTWAKSTFLNSAGEKPFQSKVTCNISSLYTILLSCMIDIYTYYIVGLPKSYEFRHRFSEYKIKYLKDLSKKDLREVYGINSKTATIPENISYLPISLKNKPTQNNLCLLKTVKDYYELIFNYIVREEYTYGFINSEIHTSDKLNEINKSIRGCIDEYQSILKKGNRNPAKYFVIYNPPLKVLDLENIKDKQLELSNAIKSELRKHDIDVHKNDSELSFYFLSKSDIPNDLFPLFPYFKWYTIDNDVNESEE